jgi:hypothetical protein
MAKREKDDGEEKFDVTGKLSSEEQKKIAEEIADAVKNTAKAQENVNDLYNQSKEILEELLELKKLSNSLGKTEENLVERTNALRSEAGKRVNSFMNSLKAGNDAAQADAEIQERINVLTNQKNLISQISTGRNARENAQKIEAIDIALEELKLKQDIAKIAGRTNEDLEHAADIERGKLNLLIDQQKKFKEIEEAIAKVQEKADGMLESFDGGVDKVKEILGHIPVIGGMLSGLVSKMAKPVQDKLQEASDGFMTSFTDNMKSGKTVFQSLSSSAVGFGTVLKSVMSVAWPLALIAVLAVAWNRFHALKDAAYDFKRATGLAGEDVYKLAENFREVQMETAKLGTSIEDVAAAAKALRGELAPIEPMTKEVLSSMVVLEKNFGVTADHASSAMESFKNIGGLTQEGAAAATMLASQMATAAGLSANQIVSDIAAASEEGSDLGMVIKGDAKKMSEMAVQARLVGSSLDSAAKSAKKLLDFETSIEEELEASAILGKDLNLSRYRELLMAGELGQAEKELQRVLSGQKDIAKMTYYEKEALAKATGKEISELERMQRIQRQFPNLAEEQLAAATSLAGKYSDLSQVTPQMLADETERLKKQEHMIGETQKLKNEFKEIGLQLANALVPLGNILLFVLKGISFVVGGIADGIGYLTSMFSGAGEELNGWQRILAVIAGIIGAIVGAYLLMKSIQMVIAAKEAISAGWAQMKAFYTGQELISKQGIAAAESGIGGAATSAMGEAGKSVAGSASESIANTLEEKGKEKIEEATGNITDSVKEKAQEQIEGKVTGATESISGASDQANKMSKIKSGDLIKGAAALLILAAALYVSAKAFQEFATVQWESVAKGLVGLVGLATIAYILGKAQGEMIKGAIAVAILGVALIPFAFAMSLIAGLDIGSVLAAAAGLVIFGAAVFALGALMFTGVGALVFGAGLLALTGLGIALIVLGTGLTMVGSGFSAISGSLPAIIKQISALSQIDYSSLFGLSDAITSLGTGLESFGLGGLLAMPALIRLTAIITSLSAAIPTIVTALTALAQMDYSPFTNLAAAITELSSSLSAFSIVGIDAIPAMTALAAISPITGMFNKTEPAETSKMQPTIQNVATTSPEKNQTTETQTELLNVLYQLLDANNGLRNDLTAGKVAVYLDGVAVMEKLKSVDTRNMGTTKGRR